MHIDMATLEEKLAFIQERVDADLSFLWAESEITVDLQYQLGFAGFRTLRKVVGGGHTTVIQGGGNACRGESFQVAKATYEPGASFYEAHC